MNRIFIEKKQNIEMLKKMYPFAKIVDLTSKSLDKDLLVLSPFYPHGNIPIPFSRGWTAYSVEGIWQGLKVFEKADVDLSCFKNNTMQGLKRTEFRFGKTLGHRKGVNGKELLDYFSARLLIYLPCYRWVLNHSNLAKRALEKLKELNRNKDLVLLDFNTNEEICDLSQPLSHAGLVKLYLTNKYPDLNSIKYLKPYTKEEAKARLAVLKKEKLAYIKSKLNPKPITPLSTQAKKKPLEQKNQQPHITWGHTKQQDIFSEKLSFNEDAKDRQTLLKEEISYIKSNPKPITPLNTQVKSEPIKQKKTCANKKTHEKPQKAKQLDFFNDKEFFNQNE